jgi:hypothetical protein
MGFSPSCLNWQTLFLNHYIVTTLILSKFTNIAPLVAEPSHRNANLPWPDTTGAIRR